MKSTHSLKASSLFSFDQSKVGNEIFVVAIFSIILFFLVGGQLVSCFLSLRVFFFILISATFRSICPPAFFRCLSNLGTFTELLTTSFNESTGVTCSDSVSHNRVQELSIPVLLLACNHN